MIGQAGNAVEVGSAGYRIIVDVPSAHPKLGFDSYSRALSRIVRESAPRFAIGVFGSWGSGKTTLMEALRIELETTPDRIITVPFSAWRYEKEEHLIVPLIDSIREAVMKWSETRDPKVAETARKGAALLGRVTKALLAGLSLKVGVPGTLDVSFEANKALSAAAAAGEEAEAARVPRSFYQAAFNALNEAFTSMGTGEGTRIVVFIDDLDRCLPTGALEVLESMKLFFDLPGFIFVVGLDRSVVEWCIDSRYQRERPAGAAVSADAYSVKGADYINKIFQVPFTLPPVAVSDMDEFIDAVIEDNGLVDPQANHLRYTVGPHLAYVVGDLG